MAGRSGWSNAAYVITVKAKCLDEEPLAVPPTLFAIANKTITMGSPEGEGYRSPACTTSGYVTS